MLKKDITNQKFGRLTALESIGVVNKKTRWKCLCDCGAVTEVALCNLTGGHSKSCGCLHKENGHKVNLKHGDASRLKGEAPEYRVWMGLRSRCLCETDPRYKWYGAKGIKVCDRWLDSYQAFIGDMGRKPSPQHSIDRINLNGDYEPSNCRWATWKEQANNKSNNTRAIFKGKTVNLRDFASANGVGYGAIKKWVDSGNALDDYQAHIDRKLTAEKVTNIRADYIPKTFGCKLLSAKYGVPVGTIKDILAHRYWK